MRRLIVVQHIEHEGPGLFEIIARQLNMNVLVCHVYLGHEIPIPTHQDILLILGGPKGVSDFTNQLNSWMQKELELIKYALNHNVPLIGVCLGAQILAYLSEGKIIPLLDPNTKLSIAEIGWSKVYISEAYINHLIFTGLNKSFYALHWHEDRILVPPIAHLLATSNRCREQMFEISTKAIGIQFHVEIEEEDFKIWTKKDNKFIHKYLGDKATLILEKQDKIYSRRSKSERITLIRNLFNHLYL